MGGRIIFPIGGFVEAFLKNPFIPLKRFSFLTPVPVGYDRGLVEALIRRIDACYGRRDHTGTLQASYEALTSLLTSELLVPGNRIYGDEDRDKLEMLSHVLTKWDKASAWLDVGNRSLLTTFQIVQDQQHIYKLLRDDKRASSIASTFGYSLMRTGNFRGAWKYILEGLGKTGKFDEARRLILGAQAILLTNAERYKEAVDSYQECCDIDEKHSPSKSSEGQLLAELGFAEAHLPRTALRGEKHMEKGLKICQDAGHAGFELQIQRDRIEYYLLKKDRDAARSIASEALGLLEKYPETFTGLRRRIKRLAEFVEEFSPDRKRKAGEKIIAYQPLQELMNATKEELRQGKKLAAMALLTVALETSTLLLCLKNLEKIQSGQGAYDRNTRGKIKDFIKSLKKEYKLETPLLREKNEWLFNAGIYDIETKRKIDELNTLRNRLFHGKFESGEVRILAPLDTLLSNYYDWLRSFLHMQGLQDYQLKEDEIFF